MTTRQINGQTEGIRLLEESPGDFVRVMIGKLCQDGRYEIPQQFEQFLIEKGDYEELISASPSWAPGKPAGVYRNEDLWPLIDRIRGRK